MSLEHLDHISYIEIVDMALKEDIGTGDITSRALVDSSARAKAYMVAKEDFVLSGMDVARYAFCKLDKDVTFTPLFKDGDKIKRGDKILKLEGFATKLLQAERVALNFLQRLSGVATLTASYVDKVKHTKVRVVDTRKTTPGLRALEKYAVRCGGGYNHRIGLFDGVLIKENHIRAAGSIANAIKACRETVHHLIKIEVEVTNLAELQEALENRADVIMLDNFSADNIIEAVKITDGKAILETSGNVNLDTIAKLAETGVDIISVGKLTHSAPAVDISLLFEK